MQVAEYLILDSHKPTRGKRWDNSLVFYIRLKMHYPKGFTQGHDLSSIAERVGVSVPTVKKHFKILLEKDVLVKDNRNYVLPQMREYDDKGRPTGRLTTIKFDKKMSSQEIKDLLRGKVVRENLIRQGFMRDLRRDIYQKDDPKRRFKAKEIKKINSYAKKYVEGRRIMKPRVTAAITLSDRTIAKWFGITRESVNRLKRRLFNDGLLLFRKILVQIAHGFPSKMDTGRLFIHKGYLYKSITEYSIPSKGILGGSQSF